MIYINADHLSDGLYNIKNGKVFKYKAKGGTVRVYDMGEIVRCKECKWWREDKSCDLNCRIDCLDGTENDLWFYTKPDDFCSYGEREGE